MLSDEVLDKVVDRLVRRIEQGNEYVLEQIGKRINKIGSLKPTEAQQLIQVFKYGGDYEKIVKYLAKITKLNVKDIKKIFEEVAKQDYNFAKQFYDYRNKQYIPFDKNERLQKQIQALATLTSNQYIDLSRTKALGFSIRDKEGNIIHQGLKETYNEIVDKAILSVSQGKTTFDDEIYRMLKNIGESGVKTLDFNGRTMRLDSAMRMHMKDALRQLHNETQLEFGKEFDADGVEISVHINPAPDHELVQGKQFSNDEYEKLQETGKATTYDGIDIDLHLELKSGKNAESFRQISQYNCYHIAFPIVLGVSTPEYTNEQLSEIIKDNYKGFVFEGKNYSMYEGTQLQRQIETEIRKQKDLQILGKTSGNEKLTQESQLRINQLTAKYNELNKASGLLPKKDRLRVSGYERVKIEKKPTLTSIEKQKDIQSITPMQEKSTKLNEILDNKYNKTSKIFKASNEHLDLTNNENINIYNATNNLNIKIYERANIKKAYYSRFYKKISTTSVKPNDLDPTTTLWHELGHGLDNYKGGDIYVSNSTEMRTAMYDYYTNNKTIPKNVEDYFNNYKESAYNEFKEKNDFDYYYNNYIEIKKQRGESEYNLNIYRNRFETNKEDYMRFVKSDYNREMRKYYSNKVKTDMNYAQLGNFSDMFSAISKGEYNDFCGLWGYHTKKYYNERVSNPTTELFANFVSLKMTGCKEHLDFFKKEAPSIYAELEKLFIEVGDDLSAK